MKKLLLLISFLVMTLPSFADKVLIGDLYYNLDPATRTAEVTYEKYKTSDNYYSLKGTLVIPRTVIYQGAYYSVTSIGDYAFMYCETIKGPLTIPNSIISIGKQAFYNCTGFTGSLTIPNSVISIEHSAFYCCRGFKGSLTIPNSVKVIGAQAFSGCYGFTGPLTIPNSVTSIGNQAFIQCSGFTGSLTIPESVTSIGNYAFESCSGLTGKLIIPNSVTSIGFRAFMNCSGFTEIELGKSLQSLGTPDYGNVFSYCDNIKSVTCHAVNPPAIYGSRNFEQTVLDNATLYVPSESIDLYRTANVWKEFMNIKEDSSDIQSVSADDGNGVHVMVDGQQVTIVNAPAEAPVRVYDLKGVLVAAPSASKFDLSGSGVYMIVVGDHRFKIFIR